jgi:hypothetical protein
MTLDEFLTQTQTSVREQVSGQMVAGAYANAEAVFTEIVMNHMSDSGMTFEPQILHIERKLGNANLRLSGYAVSDESDELDLFVSCYQGADEVEAISETEIKGTAEQCLRFLSAAASGKLATSIDQSDDAYPLILTIQDCYDKLDQIRVFVLTDRQAKSKSFKPREVAGRSVRLEVMDIERLFRHWAEGKPRDELVVNFDEVCGSPLPCVLIPGENEEYDYALTAVPGAALRLIYEKFGARLLEANVRSFLSQTGKVNQGIRDTLRNAPDRFMAYNNGIVLIADEASFARAGDGSVGISWLRGMQIVNGGQTTASIYFSKRKYPDIDLSKVRVPAKVIILKSHDPDSEETLVSDISRFANRQNTVKDSDLSANKPWHVEMEKLSREVFCPDGVSRWFYERAAGSYNVMLAREGNTPARLARLKEAIPNKRKLIKTDLAKYANTWARLPHLVALGSQKNFDRFMRDVTDGTTPIPDVAGYKRLIAQVILFKAVQEVVRSGPYNAFQANIAVYTLALLSDRVGKALSLDIIWQKQAASIELKQQISRWASEINAVLWETAGTRMVSEWAKKEECWHAVRTRSYSDLKAGIPEIG